MGLQLIFAVETNAKCKSDWIYIKDTIDRFYQYDRTEVKLTPVYMDGKGKYIKSEKQVKSLISQYNANGKHNQTKVLYCFDCDDYNANQADADFLKKVKQYCTERHYDFVWFCKDIERVYIGQKVNAANKKNKAAEFKRKNLISKVNPAQLTITSYRENTSNLMHVLDRYLTRT